jgi:hypothetical protein
MVSGQLAVVSGVRLTSAGAHRTDESLFYRTAGATATASKIVEQISNLLAR